MIEPSAVMLMLSIMPAAEPFWLLDDVAEGDAKPVSDTAPLASTRSQVIVAACAPLVHAGVLKVKSAIAGAVPPPAASPAGVMDWTWPWASNSTLPAATTNGLAAGGATSDPSAVISKSHPVA